jgi:hypothetical protein
MLGGEKLDIRLVKQDDGVGGHPLQEQFDVGGRLDGAGRIVRTAHHHDPRLACRLGHRVEIVVTVLVQRHGDRSQPGHVGEDRKTVECRRGHHDAVARAGHRAQHLHDDPGGAGADHHLLLVHPDVARDQRAQPFGQELRITVRHIDGLCQRRTHSWQRRERILVERQRIRIHRAR